LPPLVEQTLTPDIEPTSSERRASPAVRKRISIATPRAKSVLSFVDELLAEQQTLTAIERFSRKHEQGELPAKAKHYRDLIPLAKPQPGEQYAFAVDLEKCSGCKACVSACHSLNGLDDGEMWRSVGLLIGEKPPLEAAIPPSQSAYQQHVTTACHHCIEPGCADGCPVLAYEKDPVTGIVRHLDDQCIGCQYCTMKCPYDVPKYSSAKGIVRKCDMCHGRLVAGEAPACVQACPHEAIRIELVNQSAVRSRFNGDTSAGVRPSPGAATLAGDTALDCVKPFLPGSPEPRITLPTTRYISAQPLPRSVRSADADSLRLEPAHWPLIFMLVLTQLAGGLHLLNAVLPSAAWTEAAPALARAAFFTLLAGLLCSLAHLGRPLKAWRAFIGWRRSWMSREIIGFSIYILLAALLACWPTRALLTQTTALAALAAIACSAMIYVDTGRPAWSANTVFPKFFGTLLLLGTTTGAMWAGWLALADAPLLTAAATFIRIALFAWEWTSLLRARNHAASPFHRSAQTAFSLLRPVMVARVVLFAASTVFSVLAIFNTAAQGPIWGTLACAATFAGQVLERYTFFTASAPPRMPGGIA